MIRGIWIIKQTLVLCLATMMLIVANTHSQADAALPPKLPELSDSEWTEVDKAFELAYEDWDAGFTAHLATNDDPALRVMGLYMLAIIEHAATRDEQARQPYMDEIRALAENPGPNADATWIAARLCYGDCISARMIEKLARTEPGNGAVVVLDLARRRAENPLNWMDDPEVREQLLRLSQADRLDMHRASAMQRLSGALEQYVHANPFPPMPYGVGAMNAAAVLQEIMTHTAFASIGASGPLSQACRADSTAADKAVLQACQHVATLLMAGTYEADKRVGRHIQRSIINPDPDNDTTRQWRREGLGRQWALECTMPQSTNEIALMTILTLQDVFQWAQDYQSLGLDAAWLNTATKLYNRHPDAFTVSPHECQRLERLTADDVNRIFQGGESNVRWEQAFIRMEQLENAGELETLDDQ